MPTRYFTYEPQNLHRGEVVLKVLVKETIGNRTSLKGDPNQKGNLSYGRFWTGT